MSIYDAIGSTEALSLAQKQWAAVEDIRQLVATNYNNLIDIYSRGFAILNANKDGLTRMEVAVSLGADWPKFYLQAVIMKSLINNVKAGTIVDPVDEIDLSQIVFLPIHLPRLLHLSKK